ncbi:GTP-binding protein [Candidatus Parcubacteria bacterium]|nr:GTP-binding protein [Candidatus Parcubacteria bacterium]
MSPQISKENKIPRPPVVGIFGHIDHGKSSLIDYIRKTNITEKEAGGITQHVSAYEVMRQRKDGKMSKITFLDTPGHEAFKSIRTRGASVADIATLIVSAEDGVKPQTLEVLKYIQETKLPYLVAITKIDKPSADPMRAKQSLAENGVLVEGYGGEVPVVELSAKTGQGVEDYLDMIDLIADLENFTGEVEENGSGVIIEASLDPKRGVTAVGIIKNGTVRRGMFAASGESLTPLRFLLDAENTQVDELTFSSPVKLIGWDKLPPIGEEFKTFLKKDDAIDYLESIKTKPALKTLRAEEAEGVTYLPLIIKTDTAGSLEAIQHELAKNERERIKPRFIATGVGSVNENDIKSAISTSGALVVSFHTKIESNAASLAPIIYELTDKIKEVLAEREPKIEVEVIAGSAKVLKLFSNAKGKQVIGARVLTGTLSRGNVVKIMRREAEIGHGKVKELQQAKIATDSVSEGSEFGTMIESKLEIAPGDVLQAISRVTQ